jgi:hypothetical protein
MIQRAYRKPSRGAMMNSEERELSKNLMFQRDSQRKISKDEFARRYPSALVSDKLDVHLLEESFEKRDAEVVACAMLVGFSFGFTHEHVGILCRLLDVDWHHNHEDIVEALDGLRAPEAINALFRATQWVPKYLDYDDCRALGVKALWALWKLKQPEAIAKLKLMADSEVIVLRDTAGMLLNQTD